jgi:hypothetical protein
MTEYWPEGSKRSGDPATAHLDLALFFVLFFGSGENVALEHKFNFILPASNAYLVMLTSKDSTDHVQLRPSTA